jgi:acyl carrier protein
MIDHGLLERVHALVIQTVGAERGRSDIGPDTPLGTDGLALDSVGLLELTVACEAAFDVYFEFEADLTPANLRTIRTLAELIQRKRSTELR